MLSKITCGRFIFDLFTKSAVYLKGTQSEGGKVKVGRLVLDLVLVLPLLLAHVLEVEDGPPLRVVEAGGPVEHAEEEERGGRCSDHLKTVSPANRSEGDQSYVGSKVV